MRWRPALHKPGEVGPDGLMHVRAEADAGVVRDALYMTVGLHHRAIVLWKKASAGPSPTDDEHGS